MEQISHKKSLRAGQAERDRRRQLLKQRFGLDEAERETSGETEEVAGTAVVEQSEVDVEKELDEDDDGSGDLEEYRIEEMQFRDLLKLHNKLLNKESETNSSIKNAIYDNYYDLIKVKDALKEFTDTNEAQLAVLKKNVMSLTK